MRARDGAGDGPEGSVVGGVCHRRSVYILPQAAEMREDCLYASWGKEGLKRGVYEALVPAASKRARLGIVRVISAEG